MGVLYARVAGNWVPISGGSSGTDEVAIGTDDPIAINTAAELWYDTDDEPAAADSANYWNSSWGVVAIGTLASSGAITGAQALGTVVAPSVSGRRYRINFFVRALGSSAAGSFNVNVLKDGVQTHNAYMDNVMQYGYTNMTFLFVGDGASHTWALNAGAGTLGGAVITAYLDAPNSHLEIEDIGPVTRAAVNPPAGQPTVAAAGNALGVVGVGTFSPLSPLVAANTLTQITTNASVAMSVGRRYRVYFAYRAGGASGMNCFLRDGSTKIPDTFGVWPVGPTYEWLLDGDGTTKSLNIAVQFSAATQLYTDYQSYFYVEDVGPNSAPALPIPETAPGWTPLTLINSWVSAGAIWGTPSYRKIGDIVSIRGCVSGGALGSSVFVLPVGFRSPVYLSNPTGGWGGSATVFSRGYFDTGGAYFVTDGATSSHTMNFSFSVTP